MLSSLRELSEEIQILRVKISRLKTAHVNQSSIKNETRDVVDGYFRSTRPNLLLNVEELTLNATDLHMHKLLDINNKRVLTKVAKTTLSALTKDLLELEKIFLTKFSPNSIARDCDKRIIQTLQGLSTSAANSYKQGLDDLTSTTRTSWKGPATELREALRECLDRLAPDEEVKKQPNFKLEKDTHKPTMAQKGRYILKSRDLSTSVSKPTEDAIGMVEAVFGSFIRSVYSRSSISAHTLTTKDEVLKILNYVRLALCDLLDIK